MENFNAESHFSDEESDESSPGDRPVRRVAVPATALHGVVGVRRESVKPPEPLQTPRLETLFASEQHRRQEAQLHAERAKHDEDEEDDDTPASRSTKTATLPVPKTADFPDLEAAEATSLNPDKTALDSAEIQEIGLSQEAVDKEFNDIVEISLRDLQALPPHEHEPQALDPSVAEVAARDPLYEPLLKPTETTNTAVQGEVPVSEAPVSEPGPSHESGGVPSPEGSYMPASETGSEAPDPTPGTGGNLPPPPPTGPAMEAASSPEPEPLPGSDPPMMYNRYHTFMPNAAPSFAQAYAHGMSPGERFYIDAKLDAAEAARRRGDMLTGLIAGWALVRTFRNRKMIKQNAKETKKQFDTQERAMANLAQQNSQLRERANRAEQAQQFGPNRFRPAPAENVSAQPQTPRPETAAMRPPGLTPEFTAASAAEKVRQIHEQQEEVLRRQTLEVPPEHEVVRSQWHSIEVDKKTGKAVEQPTGFEYGEAFQQERRREQLQDKLQDASTSAQQSAAPPAAGQPSMYDSQWSHGLPPAAMPQAPSRKPSKKELAKTASKQITSAAANPWFWAAIIFLLIVFFTAAWF